MSSVSPEIEIASDAAIRSFMGDSYRRHFGLREMLDGDKESVKTEAMKRIVNLIATGKDDVSDLFDAVVKNVASKNPELKMLVYMYLTRYAEEQQDLALLSISTFQKALKDPNQLIRASALRVLSSIRVPIIVPIMMLVIRESIRDMSAYVRKVAAHAIPKLYQLDPDQKEQLVDAIDTLLGDKATLVIGSAANAFQEVCPERLDLIHKHYRKLCIVLMDVDEWGQVVMIAILTRYARMFFADPNKSVATGQGASESSDSEVSVKEDNQIHLDPDLALLIKSTKSLLQSRSAAVVLAVAQLYYYVAPDDHLNLISRPLIRLIRGGREIQSIVLSNIASISARRKNMFEPHLKNFFVRSTDTIQVKRLKLEILTNIANPTNIGNILREFQIYVSTYDKQFAADTIEVIGRCACNIEEVRDTCLKGLVTFMSSTNDLVVAESVIVIKNLLQREQMHHRDIVVTMTKLIDKVTVPAARASILWLVGEHCEEIPRLAPDVLRKVVLNFVHEEDVVKLQAINLAVKLHLTNPEKTRRLAEHVLNLGRYDQSYDIRDRVRFLRNILYPASPENRFSKIAKRLFFTSKPVPCLTGSFVDREAFQLGTLSHFFNQRCAHYVDLPPFAEVSSDSSLRGELILQNREIVEKLEALRRLNPDSKCPNFVEISGEEEDSDGVVENSEENSDEESGTSASSESSSEDGSSEDTSRSTSSSGSKRAPEKRRASVTKSDGIVRVAQKNSEQKIMEKPKGRQLDVKDLLADIYTEESHSNVAVPLVPMSLANPVESQSVEILEFEVVPASYVHLNGKEILNKLSGRGVTVALRFTRSPNICCETACSVELQFCNQTDKTIDLIRFDDKLCASSIQIYGLNNIKGISPGQTVCVPVGIGFGDSTQPVTFSMNVDDQPASTISFAAPVGEQLQPIKMSPQDFSRVQGNLKGLNENYGQFIFVRDDVESIQNSVLRIANVHLCSMEDFVMRFAGQTLGAKHPLLLTVQRPARRNEKGSLRVNCENVVIGSMLFKQVKASFT